MAILWLGCATGSTEMDIYHDIWHIAVMEIFLQSLFVFTLINSFKLGVLLMGHGQTV